MSQNDKIVHNVNNSTSLAQKAGKPKLPGLLGKKLAMDAARAEAKANAVELPNRIALLLDVSGSMDGEKIRHLQQAYDSFIGAINPNDTAIAVAHFGYDNDVAHDVPLTTDVSLLLITSAALQACGGTPMSQAMERVIETQPITRAVMISDGAPDSQDQAFDQAATYREAGVPCDCVHIGPSMSGEEVLKKIAEITGGIYMKFTNTGNFAKAFSFLTPANRALMLSGNVSASDIGANEIKFLGGR